ncbi:MAG TPA: S1C family serine protease, partial [Polyangiaceae bacterium]|nr:S1C family serine protease [Polyangiaceae bacterium]
YPLDATRSNPQSQAGVISGDRPDGSLQLAVALNPGNSGGPVIDESGQLLGIAIQGSDPRQGAQGIGVAVPLDQIRESLAKVRQGHLLEKVSAELATHRAQDLERATFLSALMTSDGVVPGLHLRADADEQVGAVFWTSLKHAVQNLGAEAPQLILLAAARHFNNAVWRRQGASSEWASAMQTARALVERAVGYDPTLSGHEFVKLVLQNSRDASYPHRTPASRGSLDARESSPSEDDDALLLGDLVAKRRLPTFGIGPTLFGGYQTQLFGVGLSGWLYFEKAFHLYYRYAYGVTLTSRSAHFAEAYAGFPISTSRGATSVKLIVNADYQPGVSIYSYVPRSIPDVSMWLGEAGVYLSPIDYFYCDQACRAEDVITGEDDDTQEVATLAAGVRYRYFYYASGPGLVFNARQHVDVALHALAFGFGAPDEEDLYNSFTEEEMKESPLGVRASAAGILAP